MSKITVVIADDHRIVRQGLRALLSAEADIEVVGEAENGRAAVNCAIECRPAVVVMDVAMPIVNGVEATRLILSRVKQTRILALTSYGDDECLKQMVKAGAAGFILKRSAACELLKAIREVARGNTFFAPSVSKRLREHLGWSVPGSSTSRPEPQLTAREAQVLRLVAEGFANKQIARELGISVKTVEKHRQQVMNKLGIHDAAGLTRHAVGLGIVGRI